MQAWNTGTLSIRTLVPLSVALCVAAGAASFKTVHGQDDPARPAFYTTRVKPIFDASCTRCHGGLNRRGGLNMDTRAAMLTGGHHGAALVPGDPDKSLLLKLIKHEGPADDPMDMPPHAERLSADKIAVVEAWIRAGAVMPPPAAP